MMKLSHGNKSLLPELFFPQIGKNRYVNYTLNLNVQVLIAETVMYAVKRKMLLWHMAGFQDWVLLNQ